MDNPFKEYKVIQIAESGLSAIFLGRASLPIKKMETALNQGAQDGWQVVFQVIEKKRLLLFWSRESIIITLAR